MVKFDLCFAMTEPEFAGSNPVNMATTAVRENDQYIINGHKWFTTAADGAAFTIVMALTDPQNPNPYLRASMILVPLDNPGI
ncbi:MAG: acyl-CoA dehydrogenase family protein [Cytophagales bacterium]|nr:acyl-CoA dehydrogenase family protein [Cytophagales bacterium]